MSDTRRRVKLYALNSERQWDDKGTGHVSASFVERLQGMSLLVRAEADGSLLLESKIQLETAYQKQQETLIVWTERDNFDLALSFQEKTGCDDIWEKICAVQGKDPKLECTQEVVDESEDERCLDDMMNGGEAAPPIELPQPDIARLDEISELIASCVQSPMRREKLATAIESEAYISKLINVFHMLEDLENCEGLHHLYEIFKNIFMLNKNALFEIMFAEDTIFDVVGCLEYDSVNSQPRKHRQYLKYNAKFHQVIKINNPDLLAKIHQTYRVQYIQDVVLPTPNVFEENMLSTLSSFIFFNKVEIVSLIQEDEKSLMDLFKLLKDDETSDSDRRECILFLKEFCTFSQTLQSQSRESFYKKLNDLNILQAIQLTLASKDPVTKAASIDILLFIVDFSPSMVREYMLMQNSKDEEGQSNSSFLMNVIIEQMAGDCEPEMSSAVQLMVIIRSLLDPENMLGTTDKSEKTNFLNYFYKNCMHVFIAPLLTNTNNNLPEESMEAGTVHYLSFILELLSFCVEHHAYHIRNYILHKDLLRRILVLMKCRHKFLVLCALRFMRKIVALKDDLYTRYIIKGDLFAPVVDALVVNNGRYNLLDSAILEMFEFIKLEDVKPLCAYIVENFGPTLDKITYVQTFKALRQRYDQQRDKLRERPQQALDGVGSILRQSRFRRDARDLDEDEELWFNEDESDESVNNTSSSTLTSGMAVGATAATFHQQQKQKAAATNCSDPAKLWNRAESNDFEREEDNEKCSRLATAEKDEGAEQSSPVANGRLNLVADYNGDSEEDDDGSLDDRETKTDSQSDDSGCSTSSNDPSQSSTIVQATTTVEDGDKIIHVANEKDDEGKQEATVDGQEDRKDGDRGDSSVKVGEREGGEKATADRQINKEELTDEEGKGEKIRKEEEEKTVKHDHQVEGKGAGHDKAQDEEFEKGDLQERREVRSEDKVLSTDASLNTPSKPDHKGNGESVPIDADSATASEQPAPKRAKLELTDGNAHQ